MTTTPPFIPISTVNISTDEEALVLEVLRSGHIAQGPRVAELERLFADTTGTKEAVAVSSGTAALFLSLKALDLEPGDEVITSPLTFVATLNAIVAVGATARFADIGDDYNVDPDSVEGLVNDRTRGILPIHLYGCPADMHALSTIAASHGLALVEDAAQAVGASIGTRSVGSWGLGCFSLYATKNVTTGEGGVVTTNDEGLADRLRLLRNQGMRARYEYEVRGYNLRLTDLQAALGIPQMRKLDEITERRRKNAEILATGLESIPGISVPFEPDGRQHVFHQFTIAVEDEAGLTRNELADRLLAAGVGSGVYYPKLVHDYPAFRHDDRVASDKTARAADAVRRVLSLPVHPGLTDSDLERIIGGVRSAIGG